MQGWSCCGAAAALQAVLPNDSGAEAAAPTGVQPLGCQRAQGSAQQAEESRSVVSMVSITVPAVFRRLPPASSWEACSWDGGRMKCMRGARNSADALAGSPGALPPDQVRAPGCTPLSRKCARLRPCPQAPVQARLAAARMLGYGRAPRHTIAWLHVPTCLCCRPGASLCLLQLAPDALGI